MESPLTIIEIEKTLERIRFPQELVLHGLRFLQRRLIESDWRLKEDYTPGFRSKLTRIRRRIRDQQRLLDAFPQTVYRTLVFLDPQTRVMEVAALVSMKTTRIAPLKIRGWTVHVVACSRLMHRCRVGDKIALGLVVSTDGGPILSEAERSERLAALAACPERPLSLREQRRLEARLRRLNHERFVRERQEREQRYQQRLENERIVRADQEKEKRERLLAEQQGARERREREQAASLERQRRAREEALSPESQQRVVSEEAVVLDRQQRDLAEEAAAFDRPQRDPSEEAQAEHASDIGPSRPLARSSVGLLMAVFCIGSLAGYFIARPCFSFIGLCSVGLASLVMSRLERRRQELNG